MAIEESKDLVELPIDDLIESLLTYEMRIRMAKVEPSRTVKKTIALKSSRLEIV